jgi:ligand-binding sensor domain-containing protein
MNGLLRFSIAMVLLALVTGCGDTAEQTKQRQNPPVLAATVPGDLTYQDVLQKGEAVHSLAMIDETRIWVGTTAGLYGSTSNGLWASLSSEIEANDVAGWYIDPENPQHIYIGGNRTLKVSLDGGKSWKNMSEGLPDAPDIRGIAGVRKDGELHLYAAVSGEGVYLSKNNGKWEKWLPLDQDVYMIDYHPDEDRVYVATQYGVLFSHGEKWETEPLPNAEQVYSLAVDDRDGSLYVATEQGILHKKDGTWMPLPVKAPERLVVIAQGAGDYQLVGIGESAYIYTLLDEKWTKWE